MGIRRSMAYCRLYFVSIFATYFAFSVTPAAVGHEVWIEADVSAAVGQETDVWLYWGHAGNKESGDRLAAQLSKLTAFAHSAEGREVLELDLAEDGFLAKFTPKTPGYLGLGAELQVGIVDRQVHSIPAHTRIVMYGKTITRVAGDARAASAPIGLDLELVPVAPAAQPRVRDLMTVRVLHKGQPVGGRQVQIKAATSGGRQTMDDPRVQNWEWSTEAMADPRTGEATFPLIVAGQHLFIARYTDETAGTYDGPRNDKSDFSYLRPGDTFERTMHVSTLTIQVAE